MSNSIVSSLPQNNEVVKDFMVSEHRSLTEFAGGGGANRLTSENSEKIQDTAICDAPDTESATTENSEIPKEMPDDEFEARLNRAFTISKTGENTKALFDGNWQEKKYKNIEHAVSELCRSLAWIMRGDKSAVDKAFRRSKLFDPAVWDQEVGGISRGQLMIQAAIDKHKGDFFTGNPYDSGENKPKKNKKKKKKDSDDTEKSEPKSQATILVEIGVKSELFFAEDTSYATTQFGSHSETWAINSRGFKDYLRHAFYKSEGRSANAESVKGAINTLSAIAKYDGREKSVFNRITRIDGNIYIDLCNANWEVVRITPTGWDIIKDPSVKFVRSANALPLPYPVKGGNVNDLKRVLNNISDENFCLLIGWLIGAHIHDLQYPILVFSGTQGTAKSVTSRMIKSLVDPNKTLLRKFPKDSRDLMIAAKYNHCLAFDNVSGLSAEVSDDLCRLSTGAGLGTRTLFENDEETVFEAKRPVILNGIDAVGKRSDLAERSIVVELDFITKRRRESDVVREFEKIRPNVLGVLYDAISVALRNESSVSRDDFPRMADFAAWAVAAQAALPFKEGLFLEAYSGNRQILIENSIENDLLARTLVKFMEDRVFFDGTATDLKSALEEILSEGDRKQKEWAKSPAILSTKLRRIMPPLREIGIIVENFLPQRVEGEKSTRRRITITKE